MNFHYVFPYFVVQGRQGRGFYQLLDICIWLGGWMERIGILLFYFFKSAYPVYPVLKSVKFMSFYKLYLFKSVK